MKSHSSVRHLELVKDVKHVSVPAGQHLRSSALRAAFKHSCEAESPFLETPMYVFVIRS